MKKNQSFRKSGTRWMSKEEKKNGHKRGNTLLMQESRNEAANRQSYRVDNLVVRRDSELESQMDDYMIDDEDSSSFSEFQE